MTTEEKAKAYDEALERAKNIKSKILQSHLSTESCKAVSEYIDEIIPELRESEDERIRKWLIELVKSTDTNHSNMRLSENCKLALAYLEKQKEPHYTKRNAIFDKCVENCDPEVMKEVSNKVDEMLGKEQKPSCWNSPVMTHEMIMNEQKPAEWSEEDETHLGWIIECFDSWKYQMPEFAGQYQSAINWLKSLRPQPKAEWSEENKKAWDALYKHFSVIYPGDGQFRDTKLSNRQITDFLKSLRPSWKPSEEQMKALQWWSELPSCSPGLKSLYEDLKKL